MDEMTAASLPELALRVKTEHAAFQAAARRTLAHALEAGRLLSEAKALLPHGEWGPWLKRECDIPARTATHYMRLHARRAELGGESGNLADLTQTKALKLLAGSDTESEFEDYERLAAESRKEIHLLALAYESPNAQLADVKAAADRLLVIHNEWVERHLHAQARLGKEIITLKAEFGLSEEEVLTLINMPLHLSESEQAEFWEGLIAGSGRV